jgi:hypothetical protein
MTSDEETERVFRNYAERLGAWQEDTKGVADSIADEVQTILGVSEWSSPDEIILMVRLAAESAFYITCKRLLADFMEEE